jgi:hypothetical protein
MYVYKFYDNVWCIGKLDNAIHVDLNEMNTFDIITQNPSCIWNHIHFNNLKPHKYLIIAMNWEKSIEPCPKVLIFFKKYWNLSQKDNKSYKICNTKDCFFSWKQIFAQHWFQPPFFLFFNWYFFHFALTTSCLISIMINDKNHTNISPQSNQSIQQTLFTPLISFVKTYGTLTPQFFPLFTMLFLPV